MANRTWKYAALKEEDKFTTDDNAGPADQTTPKYTFEDTWGAKGYAFTLTLWVGSIVWICVLIPMMFGEGGQRSTD